MIASPLALVLPLLLSAASTTAPTIVKMGDGQVDGKKIESYNFIWTQCSAKEGKWQSGNPLTETATIIGDHMLRIEQSGELPNGIKNSASYFLDRGSLSPIMTERTFQAPDGKIVASQQWMFDENGYHAMIFQQAKKVEKTGRLSSQMYDAMILGIPLSTLSYGSTPFALKAFMTNFDGSYQLIASKAGEETVSHNGQEVAVNWIDVKWLHEQSGDIYPAGPDASGGRYWITKEATTGLPRVIRYKTDSYAIEFLPSICPVVED